MGHNTVMIAAAAGLLALSLAGTAAHACSCQKEYMIKKHGTLNVLDLDPGPEPSPAAAAATQTPPVSGPAAPPPPPAPAGAQGGG